jgi:hypothetical protein
MLLIRGQAVVVVILAAVVVVMAAQVMANMVAVVEVTGLVLQSVRRRVETSLTAMSQSLRYK